MLAQIAQRLDRPRLIRYAAMAAVAYAIGTVQIPRLVQRRYSDEPVTDHFTLEWGEGKSIRFNAAGSTTVEVTTSPALGAATALLDMSKAVVPVLLLRRFYPGQHYEAVWAAAATIGQMLPPQHRFRGGRGEAMLTGTALALDPLSVPVSVAASQVVGIYVLRNPLLGAHSWTGILTLYFLLRRKPDLAAWTLARSTSCAGSPRSRRCARSGAITARASSRRASSTRPSRATTSAPSTSGCASAGSSTTTTWTSPTSWPGATSSDRPAARPG